MATQEKVKVVKLTVNLPVEAYKALQTMKKRSGTITQALKEAIALKLYIDKEVHDHHSKILVEREDGSVREIVMPS
jgi:hypothetical protein